MGAAFGLGHSSGLAWDANGQMWKLPLGGCQTMALEEGLGSRQGCDIIGKDHCGPGK